MKLEHVIEAQQFDRDLLEEVFREAQGMRDFVVKGGSNLMQQKVMTCLFYEPSTRTRLSFESAMKRLGGEVLMTENAREFSSAAKGESLEDTIRVVSGFCDVIVIRHYESGAAARAAKVSLVPIINAGDGPGQHPTQALLDLYTIKDELGRIDGTSIAMVGDLANGRTVRSLSYLLTRFKDVTIYFVAPDPVRMKDDIKEYLRRHKVWFTEEKDLKVVAKEVDVIYQTRIQKERFGDRIEDYEKCSGIYVIDKEILELMKKDAIIMHPLPRVDEILPEVDKNPRSAYFRQAQNGLYVRMALLKMVLFG